MANNLTSLTNNQMIQSDWLEIFQALENKILKDLNVATCARVTKAASDLSDEVTVSIFPLLQTEKEQEINCVYLSDLKSRLIEGAIVLVLFLDRDFRGNLSNQRQGNVRPDYLSPKSTFHSKKYGCIIGIIKDSQLSSD